MTTTPPPSSEQVTEPLMWSKAIEVAMAATRAARLNCGYSAVAYTASVEGHLDTATEAAHDAYVAAHGAYQAVAGMIGDADLSKAGLLDFVRTRAALLRQSRTAWRNAWSACQNAERLAAKAA